MLTSKQRAQLRSMANSYEPVVMIGKGGVVETLINQVDTALEARELIKCKVLETSPLTARECADMISEKVGADVVQVIGFKFVLYRESKENKQIVLVKAKKK